MNRIINKITVTSSQSSLFCRQDGPIITWLESCLVPPTVYLYVYKLTPSFWKVYTFQIRGLFAGSCVRNCFVRSRRSPENRKEVCNAFYLISFQSGRSWFSGFSPFTLEKEPNNMSSPVFKTTKFDYIKQYKGLMQSFVRM